MIEKGTEKGGFLVFADVLENPHVFKYSSELKQSNDTCCNLANKKC